MSAASPCALEAFPWYAADADSSVDYGPSFCQEDWLSLFNSCYQTSPDGPSIASPGSSTLATSTSIATSSSAERNVVADQPETLRSTLDQAVSPLSEASVYSRCYLCSFCSTSCTNVDQLIDHIQIQHPPANLPGLAFYYCGTCTSSKRFKNKKDFRRHLTTTKAHQVELISCRCARQFRKDKFRQHILKDSCDAAALYRCSCGTPQGVYDSSATPGFLRHINVCGRRPRGRPRQTL